MFACVCVRTYQLLGRTVHICNDRKNLPKAINRWSTASCCLPQQRPEKANYFVVATIKCHKMGRNQINRQGAQPYLKETHTSHTHLHAHSHTHTAVHECAFKCKCLLTIAYAFKPKFNDSKHDTATVRSTTYIRSYLQPPPAPKTPLNGTHRSLVLPSFYIPGACLSGSKLFYCHLWNFPVHCKSSRHFLCLYSHTSKELTCVRGT